MLITLIQNIENLIFFAFRAVYVTFCLYTKFTEEIPLKTPLKPQLFIQIVASHILER